MLKKIFIQNYALIDELIIDWDGGYTVITGETGSGKSILLGALGLITGKRADTSVLRNVGQKCVVEVFFDISKHNLNSFFEENNLDYEQLTSLRREINPQGKSRAFINDTPVNLSQLKTLGDIFVDIHSQHETLNLKNNLFQLQLLDDFAGLTKDVAAYRQLYDQFRALKKKNQQLEEEIRNENKARDFYEFQLNEIIELQLISGEQIVAEEELALLSNVQQIQEALHVSNALLAEEDGNVISQLKQCIQALEPVSEVSKSLTDLKDRINSAWIELKDIAGEADIELTKLESNPQRVIEIQDRLDAIYRLEQKHGVSTLEDLIALAEDFQIKLDSHHNREQELESNIKVLAEMEGVLNQKAAGISKKRMSSAAELEIRLNQLLLELEMKSAEIKIEISALQQLTEFGLDKVAYLLKSNKGHGFMPIESVASGGELSRVMLALKSVQSGSFEPPTLILDEIDNGVSGKVAHAMADLLFKMGHQRQLICITHLAQIAARGNSHFKVFKSEDADATFTGIKALNSEERLLEIAGMLSGYKTTDAAIENARNLMHLN
jgi:DNA repair protein RecN (Recombination protein N)